MGDKAQYPPLPVIEDEELEITGEDDGNERQYRRIWVINRLGA